jgi:hypothetical protein
MQRIFARRVMVWILSISVSGAGVPSVAYGGMIDTQTLVEARQADGPRTRVEEFMSRENVRAEMIALGADPREVRERIAALSDEELRQLEQNIDAMPAGGILVLIGAVFVVLIILELTGAIDIFKKV